MDACMEVDGRVGERRGYIYINMGRLFMYLPIRLNPRGGYQTGSSEPSTGG